MKAPSNLKKPEPFWIGRKTEIYEIMKIITQDRKCVNIYGEKNMGKTIFSKLLGYHVYSRLFFEHGVFYFSFKHLKQCDYNMGELMKRELGEEFSKHMHVYFEKKSILLIFDEFDTATRGREVFLKQHILDLLKLENIIYIICSRKNLMMEGVETYTLRPFNKEDCEEFLDFKFSSYSAIYKDFDKKKYSKEKDKILKEKKVQPQKLIDIITEIEREKEKKNNHGSPEKNNVKKPLPMKKDNSTRELQAFKKKSKNHDPDDSLFSSPPMKHSQSACSRLRLLEAEREMSKGSDLTSLEDEDEMASSDSSENTNNLLNEITENELVEEIKEVNPKFQFFKIN